MNISQLIHVLRSTSRNSLRQGAWQTSGTAQFETNTEETTTFARIHRAAVQVQLIPWLPHRLGGPRCASEYCQREHLASCQRRLHDVLPVEEKDFLGPAYIPASGT